MKDSADIAALEAFVRRFGDTFYGDLAKAQLERVRATDKKLAATAAQTAGGPAASPQPDRKMLFGEAGKPSPQSELVNIEVVNKDWDNTQRADLLGLLRAAEEHMRHHPVLGIATRSLQKKVTESFLKDGAIMFPRGPMHASTSHAEPAESRAVVLAQYNQIIAGILTNNATKESVLLALAAARGKIKR